MMSSFNDKAGTSPATWEVGPTVEPQADLDPRLLRDCCGNRIAPRLVEIRQSGERTLFVTVWQCPICNRVTF